MSNDEAYKFFSDYVYHHSGICYQEKDYYRLDSRFNALVKHYELKDVGELLSKYKQVISPEMHTVLIELCTNNETYFMRDLKPFKALGKEVYSYLKDDLKAMGAINIWSAACSAGQEPYSILMSLESFGDPKPALLTNLDASDLNNEVLTKAKNGIYSGLEVQRGLPANLLIKYFGKKDDDWEIKAHLRNKINFFEFNLLKDAFPSNKYHMIFLRNVLIYQDRDNKRKILENVYKALKPGGLLLMGAGESLIGMNLNFKQFELGKGIFYKKLE
jgi:chemotaxis protein methyltransferase CheR